MVGSWAQVLIGAISLVIVSITLKGYLSVRNWKSLFLMIAFSLIAISSIIHFPVSVSIFGWTDPGVASDQLDLLSVSTTILQSIAFAFLAWIYVDELRTHLIEFSRVQLDVLSVLLAGMLFIISYVTIGSALEFPLGILAVASFVSAALSAILLLLIASSLFSYYRGSGNASTLFAFAGFVLILLYEMHNTLSYDQSYLAAVDGATGGWATAVMLTVSLLGYSLFLFAIIRLKVKHG